MGGGQADGTGLGFSNARVVRQLTQGHDVCQGKLRPVQVTRGATDTGWRRWGSTARKGGIQARAGGRSGNVGQAGVMGDVVD